MKAPLDGIRIVDLTRVLSGPFCTMMLGDMGAEVIKVEPAKGDPIREQGTLSDGFSTYYASFNRNKKSVVIDLYSEAGRQVLERLVAGADVLVDNFRPGVMAKMGLGEERLKQLNPRLVTASVNGYGSTGPYADRPAFDFIAQAMSGLMSVNGAEGTEPMRVAQPITDLVAGLYCAFGIVSALRARDLNGTGQHVETAMMNGALSMMAYLASQYFATGQMSVRTGNDHPLVSPYGLFRVKDGEIAVAPSNDAILKRFLDLIGLGHLLGDRRYDSNDKRFERRAELKQIISGRLGDDNQDTWIARLNAAGVPCGKVQNLAEALNDPQTRAQEMVIEVDQPHHGPIRMLGFPVKLSGTPCELRHPAPALGENTRTVLETAGFSADEIEQFAAEGAIGNC